MRGSPLFRTLCFIALWACLFPLVKHLTASTGVRSPQSTEVSLSETRPTWVRIRFAHAPEKVQLSSPQAALITLSSPVSLDSEFNIELPMSSSTAQLELSVDWDFPETETLVELTLEPDGLAPKEFHFWATKRCRERVRAQW